MEKVLFFDNPTGFHVSLFIPTDKKIITGSPRQGCIPISRMCVSLIFPSLYSKRNENFDDFFYFLGSLEIKFQKFQRYLLRALSVLGLKVVFIARFRKNDISETK